MCKAGLIENKSLKKFTIEQMNSQIINTGENTQESKNCFKRSNRIEYKVYYPEMNIIYIFIRKTNFLNILKLCWDKL